MLSETRTTSPEHAEISREEIFNLLRNQRRRVVLEYLRRNDGTATLDELAEHIAADENDTSIEELSSQQRKRVYVSLYQTHLPKMDDVGLVEYDRERGTVTPLDLSHVSPYLSSESDSDVSRHFYVALAVAVIVTVGLSGIGPASAVPTTVWALMSTVTLVIVVIAEMYRQTESIT